MAVNETIVTGRKFRKCIDEVNRIWQRISFWTKACDVEFEDGKNLEQKLGSISGVTDSLVTTDSKSALSAAAGKVLNDRIEEVARNISILANRTNNLSFTVLTQAQYDALPSKDANTLYFIYS